MDEPMSRVTHDLLAEILSRVPYKSLCICKCVCPAWRDIIADPVHRKRFAQSLVGFFYQHRAVDESTAGSADPCGGFSVARGVSCVDLSAFPWASVPRTRPRLLLPPDTDSMDFSLEDSCDGLFLTRIPTGTHEARTRYVVSNPATGEYALLPHSGYDGEYCSAYLCFDSGASTQEFHVLEFSIEWPRHSWVATSFVSAAQIYSSKTNAWVSTESKWDIEVTLCGLPGVFSKGYLHLLMKLGLAVVDIQGLTWKTIPMPKFIEPGFSGCIGKSAGQLLYINSDDCLVYNANLCSSISVYVLSAEVYQCDSYHLDDECRHWKLLHKLLNVSPKKMFQFGFDLRVIGVHPHANMIFIAHSNNELVAYDLDRRESTIVYHIEHAYKPFRNFFSYVPLLSRLPLDGGIRLTTSH
ncbi:hypothetical protein ACQ4PT_070944 [Festuca glaucescens]